MNKTATSQIADIIASVLSELPRKLKISKKGEASVANGDDNILKTLLLKDGTAYLNLRFEDVDRFQVTYLSADGMCYNVNDEDIFLEHFDRTEIVADFSKKFGWVENLESDSDKKLTSEQLEAIDIAAENILFFFRNAPRTLYCKDRPVFSKDETDDANGFFLTVDIGIFNNDVTWAAAYMADQQLRGMDASDLSIFRPMVCRTHNGTEFVPAILFMGNRDPKYRLTKEDIDKRLLSMFGIGTVDNGGSDRPFAIRFIRDKDLPLVPNSLGISDERAQEFFQMIVHLTCSPMEKYEHLTAMCRTKEEVFFIGWICGSAEMKNYIEGCMGVDLDPLMHQ